MDENPNLPFTDQPTQTPQEEGAEFYSDTSNNPLPVPVAHDRASRADLGLRGKVDKSYPDYFNAFVNGQEPQMRDYIVGQLHALANTQRQNNITKLVQDKGSLLSREDLDNIPEVINDPASVVEDHFANQYVNAIKWPLGNPEKSNWFKDYYNNQPGEAQEQINIGSKYKSILEFGRTQQQDAEHNASKQGWVGYIGDMAKEMSGIYQVLKAHPSGGSWSLLAGNMREEFIRKLWQMGMEDYEGMKKEYSAYMATLNPSDAREFAGNFLEMGSTEKNLQNFFPFMGVETAVAGSLFKRGAKMLEHEATSEAVRQQIFKEIDARNPGLSAAVNAGNIQEAAVQRTWGALIKRARRADPIADALEDMPYLFKKGRQHLVDEYEQHRSVGMEHELGGHLQLIDEYDRLIKQFPELVSDLTRPERVPALAEKYKPALEEAQQQVIRDNPSWSSRIWNMSTPYWNKYTQSWWIDAIVGKSSQEAFGSLGHAGRVAGEMGMDGHELIGNAIKRYGKGTFEGDMAALEKVPTMSGRPSKVLDPALRAENEARIEEMRRGSVALPEGVAPRIEQSGTGYYIIKPIPVKETAKGMRDMYAVLKSDMTPGGGVLNSFLSRLRTPNETLSSWMTRNREAATFASSAIEKYAYAEAEAVRKLAPNQPFARQIALTKGAKAWEDFERVLNAARDVPDPNHPLNAKGYTFRNVAELQYHYMKWVGRLPTNQEVAAYFSFKRIQEMDHALRVIDIIRNKYRNGVMSTRFGFVKDGTKVFSKEFDAIRTAQFSQAAADHSVAFIGEDGKATVKHIGRLNKVQRAQWSHRVATGEYKMVRIWNSTQSPLLGISGIKDTDQIVWLIAKNISDKPLNWTKQLPWRGGGHFIPKANNYIKQVDIKHEVVDGVHTHYGAGVNTLMPVASAVEGRRIIGFLEQIRQHIKNFTPADTAAARDIVENTLHMDWNEVYSWFRPTAVRGAGGQFTAGARPKYNLTEPFQLVGVNENLLNKDANELEKRYPGTYKDATKHGDMSLQYKTEYTEERDIERLMTLKNTGTIANPTYAWSPAPLLDAIPIMDRTFTKLANTTLLNDMKIQAVETWIREAMPALKAAGITEGELQSSPLYYFHHGEMKAATGISDARIAELETARLQTKQFIGQVSQTDAITHVWSQKLVDWIYEKAPGTARWLGDRGYDDIWLGHELSDPSRLFRAATFHLKMGLFAIPQLVVQGQTYTNIFGIAGPIRAGQGTAAALLMQYSRINPSAEMLRAMGKHAENFGWRVGQWEAARLDALSSGFFNVGREYALRDDPMSNKMIKTLWGNFLDIGATPFTEGERGVRYGAWFTAWKEYAEETGKLTMTNADKLKILNRASLLNGNMNRASNALFQRGWAAFPAQFYTYTLRQAELIWGKRLTPGERIGLLASNAIAYGIPVGLGITGIPSDWFRQNMLQNGYVPGDNWIESFFTEGAISTLLEQMTGTYYNVGERLGTTGAQPLYEFMYGNKTAWDMAVGASGTVLKDVWEAFDPFRRKIMSTLRDDPEGFNILPEHYLQIAKEASSVSNTIRAGTAAATGKLFTKKGELLSDKMDMFSSVLMGLTGLQPQEATDLFIMSSIRTDEKATQDWGRQRFIQEYHRALEAYDNKDSSNGDAFMTNAFAYMKLYAPEEEESIWLNDASKNWETVIARNQEAFALKRVPPDLREVRRNQYIRRLNVQ